MTLHQQTFASVHTSASMCLRKPKLQPYMQPWQTPGMVYAGMLFYGNKYWGITEANYLLVILHSMTGYFGSEMWRSDVAAMLGIKLPFTLLVNDCLLMFIAFFAISYSLAAFYRVLNVDQVLVHAHALSTCFKATLLPDITDAKLC